MIDQLIEMLITIALFFGCLGIFFVALVLAGKGIDWLERKVNKKLMKK